MCSFCISLLLQLASLCCGVSCTVPQTNSTALTWHLYICGGSRSVNCCWRKQGFSQGFFSSWADRHTHKYLLTHALKKNARNAASCTCQRVQDNRHSWHVCKYKCNKYSVMIVCVHTPSLYSITSHRAQHTCARCTLKTLFFYQCVWETNARAAGVIFKSAESTCTWNSFNFSTLRILFNNIEKPVIMVSMCVCLL